MSDFTDTEHKGHRGRCGSGWWEERSLGAKIAMGIGFGFLGVGFVALFGLVVMSLWNWLMPSVFGLGRVTYWQGIGLLLLARILFKGSNFGDHSHRHARRRKRHLRKYVQEETE